MNKMSAQLYPYNSGMRQFYLMRPTTVAITHFLQEQAVQPFSYPAVGATKTTPPAGYVVDHNRVQLGSGATCYHQACAALQRWEMFNLGWLHLYWPTTPVATGATVGVLAQVFGFYILNACRIVYTIDETTADYTRFGFAYGTLHQFHLMVVRCATHQRRPAPTARKNSTVVVRCDRQASDALRLGGQVAAATARPAMPSIEDARFNSHWLYYKND